MKRLVDWFAENSVAANLLMLVLMVGGGVTLTGIRTEVFPEFSLDLVTVTVPYPGAAPEEVEESICVKIEEEVHDLDGVREVSSTAAEGVGTVSIEVAPGEDPRRVLDDVKSRVDAIDTFPEDAEQPIVQEVLLRYQVVNVAVSGDVGERTLKRVGERVRDELSTLPEVSQVRLAGDRPYEISIELDEADLQRLELTFAEVADAVRRGSLDLSGGSVKSAGGEVLLRTKTQAYTGEEFDQLVLRSNPDGSRVLLGDVATVIDGFADTDKSTRFNGDPAVIVQVFRVGDQNALELAEAVHEYVDEARARMPAGVELTTWLDQSVFLRGRLELLLRNGLQGLALVFLVLALFLRFRLAFWVSLGIPISFLGAIWLLPGLDASINMLSLFAFIVVLGIVVDDAIVVGESIFSEQRKGTPKLEAAKRGAERVALPVTFAVMTTVLAFLPLVFLPGTMGKFFKVMPLVVIPTLLFSWLESKLILPAHLAHQSDRLTRLAERAPFRWWVRFQDRFADGLERFARRAYAPSLELALRHRYLTFATAVAMLLAVTGLVRGGFVKFTFFNEIEGDFVVAYLTMPQGTPAATTADAVARIEGAARELQRQLDQEGALAEGEDGDASVVKNFLATVGQQPFREQQGIPEPGKLGAYDAPHLGEVVMELRPAEERTVEARDVVQRWRELTGPIPGAVELLFTADVMSAGDAINVQLAGRDVDALRAAADDLKAELASYAGVYDIADSYRGGKRELRLDVRPSAEALGLTRADLARQVRAAFHGEEAQRIQRGRDDVKVMVRYPEERRQSLATLDAMRVRLPDGTGVPFSEVARVETGRGYATIRRSDRQRTIQVTADVDKASADQNRIITSLEADVLPRIAAAHPGVSHAFEGENKEQRDTMAAMSKLFLLSLLGIYALMAIPFKSYVQPLIVMTAIPFGLVGAIAGHLVLGIDMSVLSMLGIVALAGVVVNDSLVLVDFVNRFRAEGHSVLEAARVAGVQRFRPILLTSLTTFAGLTPLMLERSVQAQFLIPMAVSLAFGVIFSTFISLVFVPATYLILDDLVRLPRRLLSRDGGEPATA